MAALVVGLAIATSLWGERIGINGGQGWDGETYVQWVADFHKFMFQVGTTAYHAQRVLPSALLHYALHAFGVTRTVPHILSAFFVFDTLMLVIAAALWSHLGHVMRWRAASVWAGFVGMFLSFGLARHALYYPALTDSAAFALGMAVTWAYLARHPIALWFCVGIVMFTWPGLTPLAAACLVLPRLQVELAEPTRRMAIRMASAAIAIVLTAVFFQLSRHYYAHPVNELGIPKFATWVRRDWLWITVPLLLAFLAVTWLFVLDQPRLWNVRAYLATVRWRYTALALAGIAAWWVIKHAWVATVAKQGPGPSGAQFACLVTLEALRGPVWGPVHHVVYFGPIVAVGLVHWRRVCAIAASWGHAAIAGLAMLVIFLAASESRQWIHLLPLFVAAVIAATDDRWTRNRVVIFTAVALVWSKVWLHIGYNTVGDWRQFPLQRYFMQLGPWASDTTWKWHALAAAVTTAGMWLLLRSSTDASRAASPAPPDLASAPR